MIVVMKPGFTQEELNEVIEAIESRGAEVDKIEGVATSVLGVVGDTAYIDPDELLTYKCVEKVLKVQEPYKKANRLFHPEPTIVDVNGTKVGGGHLGIMAGPCSVESEEQVVAIAKAVKASGANFLRGGAFKPRTSPNSFTGLKEEGLRILKAVKEETSLAVITELMDVRDLEKLYEVSDIIQVGSRNMQNFTLLTELGKQDKPVMLKRGIAATISEWIGASDYIAKEGNNKIIMCERGIRTYNDYTRNTLDLAAVPIVQSKTNFPVIVDPSHGTGVRELVKPMSLAAMACGADGLMIEVHPNPSKALSDGMQSLHFEEFEDLMDSLRK